MWVIKEEYKGKEMFVTIRRNVNDHTSIDIDFATQAEIDMLGEIGHYAVEESASKKKPEKLQEKVE